MFLLRVDYRIENYGFGGFIIPVESRLNWFEHTFLHPIFKEGLFNTWHAERICKEHQTTDDSFTSFERHFHSRSSFLDPSFCCHLLHHYYHIYSQYSYLVSHQMYCRVCF